jgi:hypothetical protein
MSDEVYYIDDPVGHTVCLTQSLLSRADDSTLHLQPYDSLISVILHPALLIKVEKETPELFYYRSIDWQLSILIQTKPTLDCWMAYKCVVNPSDKEMVEIMKQGRQII